ncbi:MAG: hypothetical protein V4857_17925 [Pseudomonadota bacterium]
MSWRSGSKLFSEIWPSIQSNIPDRELRIEFTSKLLPLFLRQDMDPFDVEDIHPDVRAAMRVAGIRISEPERYQGDQLLPEARRCRKWWKPW